MDINLIIVELLSRIKVLEEKVKMLEENNPSNKEKDVRRGEKPNFPVNKISDKYRPLAEYLYERWERKIVLTYGEIEHILDFKLPPTAYKIPRSYWANTLTHTHATSWLEVGYKAKINTEAMSVTFEKIIY